MKNLLNISKETRYQNGTELRGLSDYVTSCIAEYNTRYTNIYGVKKYYVDIEFTYSSKRTLHCHVPCSITKNYTDISKFIAGCLYTNNSPVFLSAYDQIEKFKYTMVYANETLKYEDNNLRILKWYLFMISGDIDYVADDNELCSLITLNNVINEHLIVRPGRTIKERGLFEDEQVDCETIDVMLDTPAWCRHVFNCKKWKLRYFKDTIQAEKYTNAIKWRLETALLYKAELAAQDICDVPFKVKFNGLNDNLVLFLSLVKRDSDLFGLQLVDKTDPLVPIIERIVGKLDFNKKTNGLQIFNIEDILEKGGNI